MKTLTVIDLFCGCGGISWGLYKAGFNIIAGIDNWKPALTTFKYNHPNAVVIQDDITKLNPISVMKQLNLSVGELDCLVGGPPCQGFSKNVPASYRFFEDSRNQLFRNFLSFVEIFLPKVVLMENVAEIYNAFSGVVRNEIIEKLNSLDYHVETQIIFAPSYGIPQRRRRCFFFASRTGVKPFFPKPSYDSSDYRNAWSAISDLPVLQNGEGYESMPYDKPCENEYQKAMRKNSAVIFDHITRKLKSEQFKRINSLQPGQGYKDLPFNLRPKSGYSGAYGRLDFEMLSPTITRWVFHPGSGRFCHPREVRLITIREAARIQSFSDDFRFKGTYIEKSHQLGNAVPPLLLSEFASNIKACCLSDPSAIQPLQPKATAGEQQKLWGHR